MSNVQGQIDRINGEVSAQASLISQIATALEGKTGGGGGGKFATGAKNGNNTQTFSITGLDFTPSQVVMVAQAPSNTSSVLGVLAAYTMGGYSGIVTAPTANSYAVNGGVTWTLTSGGFTAKITHGNASDNIFKSYPKYIWLALE